MKNIVKKIGSRSALTLTELLVSSMLMGVVMVGAAGYGATIKRMYDTTDKQTILAMQAATGIGHIERHISMSTGFQDTTDPNFSYVTSAGPPKAYWSFRTDPNNTPDDFTDDVWAIIFKFVGGANQYDLYACFQPVGVGAGLGPDPDNGQSPCSLSGRTTLIKGRIQAFTMSKVVNNSPSVLDMYAEITMTVSQDPTAVGDDPFDDPAFTVTTRIPMTSHSWN